MLVLFSDKLNDKIVLIPYPGLYLSIKLHEEIFNIMHIPTGVNVQFTNKDKTTIELVCLGDPRAIGPNVNSNLNFNATAATVSKRVNADRPRK